MNDKKPVKKYYTVKMQTEMPVEMVFRVLAESSEQALQLVEQNKAPLAEPIRPNFAKIRRFFAKVYDSGSNIINLSKRY